MEVSPVPAARAPAGRRGGAKPAPKYAEDDSEGEEEESSEDDASDYCPS